MEQKVDALIQMHGLRRSVLNSLKSVVCITQAGDRCLQCVTPVVKTG